MTTTLVNFLAKVSIHLDDGWSSTTTSAGNTDGTTLVDSALKKYPDGHFGDPNRDPQWWAYISTTLLPVKNFTSSAGTIELYSAYGAPTQIASSTAYSLHKYDRDKKILACNQALYECYPDFHLEITDATSLDGTGPSDNKYTVPNTFIEFPAQIWAIDDATDNIKRTQITNYEMEKISGTWYFYADITTGEDILLIGKTYLSQFTNDASTTELSAGQAHIVSYLAAAIFYEDFLDTVSAENTRRFEALARKRRDKYNELANRNRMPRILPVRQNFAWTGEKQGRVWPA